MLRICRLMRGTNGVFVLLTAAMLTVATTPFWAFAQAKSASTEKTAKAAKPARVTRPNVGSLVKLHAALRKATPVSVDDLSAIETHVEKLVPNLTAATVGVRIGRAQGSGVIVSKDGYILTAAHVSGAPGNKVTVFLPNEKIVQGISLGRNIGLDAGLIKITTKGNYAFVEVGALKQIKVGDWCIATGHPGGFRRGRSPVVRLGRVVFSTSRAIQSDAILVGGDSGGPLFDMHGRVIGINSRIGRSTTLNFHVPISAYGADWGRLARSETWGRRAAKRPTRSSAIMGVNGEDDKQGCRVTAVPDTYPASKAGLQVGDIITTFDGKKVTGFDGLVQMVKKKKPGDKVNLVAIRKGKKLKFQVTLARRR